MFFIFGKNKFLLAFEYGLLLSECAKNLNIEITPEISKKMEDIILKEFPWTSPLVLSKNMITNILAALEPRSDIKSE